MSVSRISTIATLGHFRSFQKNPILFMDEIKSRYGDLVEFSLGPKKLIFCFHPDDAERILKTSALSYRKSRLVFDKIIPVTGRDGLVQLEGNRGKEQRRITAEAVSYEAIQKFYPQWIENTQGFLRELELSADKKLEVDLSESITSLVLKNAFSFVFGEPPKMDGSVMADAFLEVNTLCGSQIRNFAQLPQWIPTRKNLKLKNSTRILDRAIGLAIEQRYHDQTGLFSHDLLSVLIRRGLDRNQIHDHLKTFLFAGHETTSSSLIWTFYLLGKNPEVATKMRDEISSKTLGKVPDLNQLRRLCYTLNVYQESLRLFPPAWTLAREAIDSTQLGSYSVKKGTQVMIGVGQIHRHPGFWSHADEFLPERFQNDEFRHPFAFIPFGGGSRICIGMRSAFIEATLILSRVVPEFAFHIGSDFQPEAEAMITSHPRNGLPVKVEKWKESCLEM